MAGRWPALDFEAEKSVYATVHAFLQVIGKLPTRALPWCNHSWHLAMLVVPTGFRTYPLPTDAGEAEILLDCLASRLVLTTSDGRERTMAATGQSVAAFHSELSDMLRDAGVATSIDGGPNEVEEAIPFAQDDAPRSWDGDIVRRLHRAFSDAARVMYEFRTGFVGKSSPVHLFWGSFDLAVTRFSGREAPLHPGGFPNLPDDVTREAYSHEVASFGFWPGGGGVEERRSTPMATPRPMAWARRPSRLPRPTGTPIWANSCCPMPRYAPPITPMPSCANFSKAPIGPSRRVPNGTARRSTSRRVAPANPTT